MNIEDDLARAVKLTDTEVRIRELEGELAIARQIISCLNTDEDLDKAAEDMRERAAKLAESGGMEGAIIAEAIRALPVE